MQWGAHHPFETTADPVIAKGPDVMPNTVTQWQKMPQCYRPPNRPCWMLTNVKATPSTENTSSSSLTKLNYISLYYIDGHYYSRLFNRVLFVLWQDLHAGPRTLLPHGASFHGYPININVSSDLPRQELMLQVSLLLTIIFSLFFTSFSEDYVEMYGTRWGTLNLIDAFTALKPNMEFLNITKQKNSLYNHQGIFPLQCHSNESLKSLRHRIASRLNTTPEQIQLSTSEKLVWLFLLTRVTVSFLH